MRFLIKKFGLFISIMIFTSMLFLNGCNETSSTQPINRTMLSDLIGQWHSDYYGGIVFYEDGTFVDSIKTWYCTSTTPKAEYIVSGTYKLEDSTLIFDDVKMVDCMYYDSLSISGVITYYTPAIVTFVNGELRLRKTMQMNKVSSSVIGFEGEWKTSIEAAVFQRNKTPKLTGGDVNLTFKFNSRTSKCSVKKEILFNSMFSNTSTEHDYYFENDWLDIIDYGSYFVEWIEETPYWTTNTVSYKRVSPKFSL